MNKYVSIFIQANATPVQFNNTNDPPKNLTLLYTSAAAAVGKLVGERASKAGVKDVVFDRGAFIYHGRVKALADAAREAGLNF